MCEVRGLPPLASSLICAVQREPSPTNLLPKRVPEEPSAVVRDCYERVLAAEVYDVAEVTDLTYAPLLSERLGNEVYLKREDQQPGFSFKCRGAYNRILKLHRAGSRAGVLAASAGNHAQGVALAARRLGLRAVIVMPETTPTIKVRAVSALGAEVVLWGDDFDAALGHARELGQREGLTFIHPFDDPDTIAGQGTVGAEICDQHPGPVHAMFSCVGGGGLAAGVAAFAKTVRPEVRQIGVEAADAACMAAALTAGGPVDLEHVGLFADGAAVRRAGDLTYRICAEVLDEVMTVSVEEIAAAIKDVFVDTRTLIEPAGALGLAGLKAYVAREKVRGETLIAVVSGANINFDRLRHVVELTEVGVYHECLFAVTIPERPRSFLTFCEVLGKRAITEFNYRRAVGEHAEVFVGVKVREGPGETAVLFAQLEASGYAPIDLTQDETARLHIRHTIGGRLPEGGVGEGRERLFRFQFPERPGALRQFLRAMDPDWDITLFHYRNHGAAFGRVLVGMTLPAATTDVDLAAFAERLGYPFSEETGSEVYARFLK